MADFNLQDTIAVLARTPAVLNAMLRYLPDTWTQNSEGDGTWSVYDVVGHLIHGERTDWIPRTKLILQFGESRAFEPFDRDAQKRMSRDRPLAELIDEFTHLRVENVETLKGMKLTDKQLALRGKHPKLGTVTLAQLLATWPVHDLTHLHQISRVMAHQYREAVGPWSAFMGVLKCQGHSE